MFSRWQIFFKGFMRLRAKRVFVVLLAGLLVEANVAEQQKTQGHEQAQAE
jgi:hypothetical protein